MGNRNKGDTLSYESPAVVAPTSAELTHLTHTLARRVGRFLERLCRAILPGQRFLKSGYR